MLKGNECDFESIGFSLEQWLKEGPKIEDVLPACDASPCALLVEQASAQSIVDKLLEGLIVIKTP